MKLLHYDLHNNYVTKLEHNQHSFKNSKTPWCSLAQGMLSHQPVNRLPVYNLGFESDVTFGHLDDNHVLI